MLARWPARSSVRGRTSGSKGRRTGFDDLAQAVVQRGREAQGGRWLDPRLPDADFCGEERVSMLNAEEWSWDAERGFDRLPVDSSFEASRLNSWERQSAKLQS